MEVTIKEIMMEKMTKSEEKQLVRAIGILGMALFLAFLLGMGVMYGWLALNGQIVALL